MTDTDIARLREMREVRIETSRGEGAPVHRTIIWVVVDDRDRVLVRSYRGAGARWYREAVASPRIRLLARDLAFEARVERATDDDRVSACSEGFRRKYAGDPATGAMVRDEVLDTTLELVPV